MLNVPTTVNGVAGVSGFTSATYTTAQQSTTFPNGKGYVVTAKGGTQPSAVDVSSASRPFTVLCTRPQTVRSLPGLNQNGSLPDVPVNSYTISTRKGVLVLAGQPSFPFNVKTTLGVPAGSDLADPDNLAAALVFHAGLLVQLAQGMVDTVKTGDI
jgi:hypothetical protein